MRKFALMAAAGAMAAMPLFAFTAPANAQVGLDVHVGGKHEGIRVEGRGHHHCHTVTTIVHHHGRTIKRTERKCD